MASSSLSQEDLEHDFELTSRRSRIRTARAFARNAPSSRVVCDGAGDTDDSAPIPGSSEFPGSGPLGNVEHDASPKPMSRSKDKRCPPRANINKAKAQRERRKLREKRRSTGVVHMPSTESTGGSTGEDEDDLLASPETKKNTVFNEAGNERGCQGSTHRSYPFRHTKSPSDLDADDEDNQDYDSAVNQSDSIVSLNCECDTIEPAAKAAVNGRPVTPCSVSTEELLERAREENHRLLDLLKEKDSKIFSLEREISSLNQTLLGATREKRKLQEENQALLKAISELQT